MIALLSSIFGIVSGLLPSLISLLQKRMEYQDELKLIELKIEAATKNLELQTVVTDMSTLVEEGKDLRLADSLIDGGQFINTLRASIRPVITYVFFGLFIITKLAAAFVMLAQGINIPDMLNAIWDTHTVALFGAIMGFWFGSRAVTKMEEMRQQRNDARSNSTNVSIRK